MFKFIISCAESKERDERPGTPPPGYQNFNRDSYRSSDEKYADRSEVPRSNTNNSLAPPMMVPRTVSRENLLPPPAVNAPLPPPIPKPVIRQK